MSKLKASNGTLTSTLYPSLPPLSLLTSPSLRVGPENSFYEGYEFDLKIDVPVEYPLVPPTIKFKTKIFHPNVKFEVTGTFLFHFAVH